MIKTCPHCEQSFTSRHWNQTYCGMHCQVLATGGNPDLIRECSTEGCGNLAYKASRCATCKSHRRARGLSQPVVKSYAPRTLNDGYRLVWVGYDHPMAYPGRVGNAGYCLEHRFVMSEQIGRPLYPFETVHHRNGDRSDNRPENLELWAKDHGAGQRVDDLIGFMLKHYRDEVLQALTAKQGARVA